MPFHTHERISAEKDIGILKSCILRFNLFSLYWNRKKASLKFVLFDLMFTEQGQDLDY